MEPITRPIRVVYDTRSWAYRSKTWIAYFAAFGVASGDTIRYLVGWVGFGVWTAIFTTAVLVMLIRSRPGKTIRLIPWYVYALYGALLLSSALSSYSLISLGAWAVSVVTASFSLWLAHDFDWRHILRVFANAIRFILGASLLFEFVAAAIVRGPILPVFRNFNGDVPPSRAFYWSQGNLFNGERIQGIMGNANLLAYVAMVGLILFAVEFAIVATKRSISVWSMIASGVCIALAKSAGIAFALTAVIVAAIVSIAVEGKDHFTRHRYYRVAWSVAGVVGFFVLSFRAEVFAIVGKSPDMTGRTMIWRKVLALIPERPLQGFGWLSYWLPGIKPYEGLVVINHVPYYQAHNAYLDMWLQGGIFSLLALVALIVITFVKLWQLAVRHTSALYLWPILVFMGIIVQNLTESRMLLELGWVLLMLFAIKVAQPSDSLEPVGNSPKRVRLLGRGLRRSQPRQQKDR